MQVALMRRLSWVLMVLLGATAATQSTAAPAAVGMPLVLEQCSPEFDPRQQYTFSRVPPYTNPAAVQRYGGCFDLSTDCAQWAKGDQCKANPGFMKDNCPKSCGLCTTAEPGSDLGLICFDLAAWRSTAKRDRPPSNKARPGVGATVNGWRCGENAWTNQYWTVNGSTLQTSHPDAPGLCLGINATAGGGGGGQLDDCTSPAAEFQFSFDGPKGPNTTIVHKASGLCLAVAGPPLAPAPSPPPWAPNPKNTPCPPLPPTPPPGKTPHGDRPCDIYASAGNPCVAAHSMVRALYASFKGPLYLIQRASDYTTMAISVLAPGGYADAAAQDTFCAGTDCEVITIFDQTAKGNDLLTRHPGRHFPVDFGVNASAQPVVVGGHHVYGARFDEGMGYRNDHALGLAVGEEPETMYAVMGGHHYNDACCFDYGNAENHFGDDGPGTMEAIYYGNCTSWWVKDDRSHIPKSWDGPILMADLEAGMYGGNDTFSSQNSPIDFEFNTLLLKGRKCEMSLKGGNSQTGNLMTKYDGGRPTHADYNPMRKQGGIVLGTGGDNSDEALGIFYEGAMTAGYASVACDDAIQANIVAAGYKGAV